MCGIIGAFQKDGIDLNRLRKATDSLRHRGPDAAGYFLNSGQQNVFLGHRRLSIIDVSDAANQPLYSADERYVIVYNGELYNFQNLKRKLPHFCWKTNSDTEVILELFAQFGVECFSWFNGIFAFAIYDQQQDKIWLCRDQLGIKPLFVQRSSGRLLFASELKAIVEAQKVEDGLAKLKVSKTAVAQFLHLGYISEPNTIYRGIKKFPAGNYAVFDVKTQEWQRHRYWNAGDYYLTDPIIDETKALNHYKETLFSAVQSQMMSDVPLGTFLSGGIDSSLVTAVAAKSSSTQVQSFSIGFHDAQYDESQYAKEVAKHLGTKHHQFMVGQEDILSLIPDFISVYDEPFADSSAFPTMLVSKLARQHVTVTLSGDGGDEFFQGYGMYQWAERLSKLHNQMARKPIKWAARFLGERYQRGAMVFDFPSEKRIPSHIFSQEQYLFAEQELHRLLNNGRIDFTALNQLPKKGTARERQAFWDVEHYLKDDLLVKVDRASMKFSLETRVPLLDIHLVQLALNLPLSMKVHPDYGSKYLMKKVLYELVPASLFDRPKRGFSMPLGNLLKKELRYLIEKYLSKQKVEYAGLVHYSVAKEYLDDFFAGKNYLYNRVWAMLVLHWWYYEN